MAKTMITTTLEIEIVIMQHIGVRHNIIVNGVHWGLVLGGKPMHECDLLILNKSNYASEVEIKTSKADLLKDKEKIHQHNHNYIKYLWFAVPRELKEIALLEIPGRAGLYVLHRDKNGKLLVKIERKAKAREDVIKWSDKDRTELMRLGTMRIITLKKQILCSLTNTKKLKL